MNGVKDTKVFLASPLFSDAERNFNSTVAERLRKEGHVVWLAQETTFVREIVHENSKKIYETTIAMLEKSNVVVAVLDGPIVDAGVAYEIGFAKALKKPVIGLRTDSRTFSRTHEVNLMLDVPLLRVCRNLDEVIIEIEKIT